MATARPASAHVIAIVAALIVVIAVSALWLVWFKSFPRGTGFDDLSGVMVPFWILAATAAWFVVRALAHGRMQWKVVTVVVVSVAFALAPVLIYCGPVACFTPGSERLLGWFVVAGVVLAALVHHVVLEARTPRAVS